MVSAILARTTRRHAEYKRGMAARRTMKTRMRRAYRSPRSYQPGELKFHDVDHDDAAIVANWTLNATSINLIPQGVTEITRIGRKCTIKKIMWRGSLQRGAQVAAAAGGEIVRLLVVQDKQCNGATATVTGVLESDDYASFRNLANAGRFIIHMDQMFAMNASAGDGDGTTEDYASARQHFSFFKDVNIPLEFSAAAGAITELTSNNLFIMVGSQAGAQCSLDSKIRLRFADGS